jgi:hypothetical protein
MGSLLSFYQFIKVHIELTLLSFNLFMLMYRVSHYTGPKRYEAPRSRFSYRFANICIYVKKKKKTNEIVTTKK